MAFSPTYTETDVAPVVIDTGLKVVVGVATFATVIGLLLGLAIGMWAFKKFRG